MIYLPSVLLLLGAVLLVGLRRTAPRTGFYVEVGTSGVAFLALVLAGRPEGADPVLSSIPLFDLAGTGGAFAGGPAEWALQVSWMAYLVASAILGRSHTEADPSRERASWLVYAALVSLAATAASLQAFVLVWAALGVAERWLTGDQAGPGWPQSVLVISSADVVGVVFLMLAGGVGSGADGPIAQAVALLGIVMACAARLLAADRAGSRRDPRGPSGLGSRIAMAGSLPAFALMARSAGTLAPQPSAWVVGLVSILLLLTALVHAVGSSPQGRRRSWVGTLFLGAWLVASLQARFVPLAFGVAGSVALSGAVLWPAVGGAFLPRAQAAAGALLSAGLPYLGSGVLAGLMAMSPGTTSVVAMVAIALLASRFWRDASRPGTETLARTGDMLDGFGLGIVLGASAAVYLVLWEGTPAWVESLVVLGVSVIVSLVYRFVPAATLGRLERAFRLPDLGGAGRASAAVRRTSLRAVRGLRDVLEGDASLLWAFVIVLVAFLVLRQAGP